MKTMTVRELLNSLNMTIEKYPETLDNPVYGFVDHEMDRYRIVMVDDQIEGQIELNLETIVEDNNF